LPVLLLQQQANRRAKGDKSTEQQPRYSSSTYLPSDRVVYLYKRYTSEVQKIQRSTTQHASALLHFSTYCKTYVPTGTRCVSRTFCADISYYSFVGSTLFVPTQRLEGRCDGSLSRLAAFRGPHKSPPAQIGSEGRLKEARSRSRRPPPTFMCVKLIYFSNSIGKKGSQSPS